MRSFKPVDSDYQVAFDGSFKVRKAASAPPASVPPKTELTEALTARVAELADLQHRLYADNRYSLLLVFQAMDAAGKDSTIRAVLSGVDPAGCEVYAFKRPSETELDHDFLWRTTLCLPQRGRIGVFNRSHYEEVLVVRVHPEFLTAQRLPDSGDLKTLWKHRYTSIRDYEKHLARNGTVILKFWLNVSPEEQKRRFLARLDEPQKNWKFEAADLSERARWKDYMRAYEEALNETSVPHAPWYAIPADNKAFMQLTIADIVVRRLKSLNLRYPELATVEKAKFAQMRKLLESE